MPLRGRQPAKHKNNNSLAPTPTQIANLQYNLAQIVTHAYARSQTDQNNWPKSRKFSTGFSLSLSLLSFCAQNKNQLLAAAATISVRGCDSFGRVPNTEENYGQSQKRYPHKRRCLQRHSIKRKHKLQRSLSLSRSLTELVKVRCIIGCILFCLNTKADSEGEETTLLGRAN